MLFRPVGMPAIYFDTDPDGGGSGAGPDDKKKTEVLSFTQAQLNVLMGDRAEHARSAALREILDATGAESLDKLKALVESGKTWETAKTDLENRAQTAERERTEAQARVTKRLMDVEIRQAAEKAGFLPEALDDVLATVDRTKVTVKEDDVFEGVTEAVKLVADAKKHWLKSGKSAGGGVGTPKPEPQNPQQNNNQPAKRPLVRL